MAKEDTTMTDGEVKPEKIPENPKQSKDAKLKGKGKVEDTESDLSEEDQAIKANLEMMVERTRDSDIGIQANALEVTPKPVFYCHSSCAYPLESETVPVPLPPRATFPSLPITRAHFPYQPSALTPHESTMLPATIPSSIGDHP